MTEALRIPVSSPRTAAEVASSNLWGSPPSGWGEYVRGRDVVLELDATPRSQERIDALVGLVLAAGAASCVATRAAV